ncbi:MAG: extracellular catalytic domain type 1 short-chain-length polyhydroxyalkanoate depolymerase [Alphaproteobacteria bacterium]
MNSTYIYNHFILALFFSALCFSASADAWDTSTRYLQHNGEKRSYIIHIPEEVKASKVKVPMVIVLHGGGGNAEHAERSYGFSEKADQEGFIAVYPNGTAGKMAKFKTWNVVHCCGPAMKNKTDDIGFLSTLIDYVIDNHPADPSRVFITGMSNGGMMTHRAGIALSDKVTAIAPVASGLFGDESFPKSPVSALIINGALDKSFPMNGGKTGGKFSRAWDGTSLKPVSYQGEFWAKHNACNVKPVEEQNTPSILVQRYTCSGTVDVIHYIVKDNGHAWPGGKQGNKFLDKPSQSINATDIIWDFFKAQ